MVRGIAGQADWVSSTCPDDIDSRAPFRIKIVRIEGNTLSIGRPTRVPATRARRGKQVHGVGAIRIADPDAINSTAVGNKDNPLAVRRVLC
jgi:hypothetical protein